MGWLEEFHVTTKPGTLGQALSHSLNSVFLPVSRDTPLLTVQTVFGLGLEQSRHPVTGWVAEFETAEQKTGPLAACPCHVSPRAAALTFRT